MCGAMPAFVAWVKAFFFNICQLGFGWQRKEVKSNQQLNYLYNIMTHNLVCILFSGTFVF